MKPSFYLFLFLLLLSLSFPSSAQDARPQIIVDPSSVTVTALAMNGDGSRIAVSEKFYHTPTISNAGRVTNGTRNPTN